MKNTLYGDGIHDDTLAIQEMIDTRQTLIYLSPPEKHYVISASLVLHSNQELRLDAWTEVVLAPKSNVAMLTNDDYEGGNTRISITGGIWNGNNTAQAPNPQMVTTTGELSGDGVKRMAIPADWPIDPMFGRPATLFEVREEDMPWHPKR